MLLLFQNTTNPDNAYYELFPVPKKSDPSNPESKFSLILCMNNTYSRPPLGKATSLVRLIFVRFKGGLSREALLCYTRLVHLVWVISVCEIEYVK